jgi:hypothetical protein
MNIIDKYREAKQELYDHVGFTEDWVVCPIEDNTEMFWNVDGDVVKYADNEEDFYDEDGQYYEDDIYTQRFYKKWVYKGNDFTMIFCDPHVDGVKWFRFFDNKKKLEKR